MNWLDIVIIVIYSIGLLSLGYFFKDQKDADDYFLGGRSFGWFEMGLSTMASQLSAISFISAAAFVGLKVNGGMQWLSFEFAVPLAMIFLIVVLIPPLYNAGIVSIYTFLEKRFSPLTRVLISMVFQISRAFATGIMIYTVALVLSAVLEIPEWQTILIAGIVTIIYSVQGGMKAVVWGDVIQMIILIFGILICTGYGLSYLSEYGNLSDLVNPNRLDAIDYNWGFAEGEEFGMWPMIIGGFFLYISYYGCDQSQAQRCLSGRNMKEVRRALMFNGLFRFPITLCYCLMGLVIGTYAVADAEFLSLIPSDKPDYMIPLFIANKLPNGIIGLLLVAILAAAMSSLSSAINSLSAATVEDLIRRTRPEMTNEQHLRISKYLTIFWGLVCIVLAFSAGNIASTVIEAINKVGSAFYGPIVATFILAILTKRTHALGANIGLLVGVGVNLYIWISGAPIFWIWWNFIGAIITLTVAYGVSVLVPQDAFEPEVDVDAVPLNWWTRENAILVAGFVLILLISANMAQFFN